MVCCYCRPLQDWFEVDLINENITAANVISVTKAHFACYSVPDRFLSDNGPHMSLKSLRILPRVMILITRLPNTREPPVKQNPR